MMKKILLVITSLLALHVGAQDINKDKEAIKKVIQTAYVEGLQNEGNLEKVDSGIHPGFNLIGIAENNEVWVLPIEQWKERTEKKVKDGKLPRTGDQVSVKFENIDVTGTAAVAKIGFYVGDKKVYVDYISLYKFDKGWMMINKIYYKLPEK